MSVSRPLQNAVALSIPAVPSGFTIAIKSVNPSNGPLNTSGVITPPLADTVVSVIFTVTKTSDGTTADTIPISVLIPAKLTYTAKSVADSISVMDPAIDSTTIAMPVLPAGFTYVLKSGVPTGIIAANGTITFPTAITSVSLVFTVTRTLDGSSADSPAIVISVPAKANNYPAPSNFAAVSSSAGNGANKGVITLTWVDNTTGETGFTLERATDSAFTIGLTSSSIPANTSTVVQDKLANGTLYYFRIQAVSGTSWTSAWSATVSAATPVTK